MQIRHYQLTVLAAIVLAILGHPMFADVSAQDPDPEHDEAGTITLDQIMADPEWIGTPPESAFWADNSGSIYYERKQTGSVLKDWFQSDLSGNLLRVVEAKDLGRMDAARGVYDAQRKWKAYERNGDLFLKRLADGNIRQLTRTVERESSPEFMADGRRLMFRRGSKTLARHLVNGLEEELVDVRLEDDPEEKSEEQEQGFLPEQQLRLFEVLDKQKKDEETASQDQQEKRESDQSQVLKPFYLGNKHELGSTVVSPNGRWALVHLQSKLSTAGTQDKMPEFVQRDGYVNVRNVRPLVGTGKFDSDRLVLIDLRNHAKHEIDLTSLPQADSDPLEEIRASGSKFRIELASAAGQTANNNRENEPQKAQEKTRRPIEIRSIAWNKKESQVVIEVLSYDNKDRWIASLNFKSKQLETILHHRDEAWIGWDVGSIDWLADDDTIFYLSESTGFNHINVTHVPSKQTRQLTSGSFVVGDIKASIAGDYIYYKANASEPGIYEIFRVEVSSGRVQQLTKLGGMNDYALSPDETHLLITHSSSTNPQELWVQSTTEPDSAKQITQTVSSQFANLPWVAPQFVKVPSTTSDPIYARLYLPPGYKADQPKPAVIFIHGAGYLQNAHQGWSGYFREFMFHSLLAHRGFVILDMDYRASAGYGRDWRTAIYRNMGGPELEDLEAGKKWLVDQHGVDAGRVGLYGGSYGGFLTLMALFKKPGEFACGAALRPVTDWAHYNHGYTSNILNTPDIDPEAYYRSSPIEYAAGLEDPLLICHGMVDDNVFFKDTARLAQRLIELKKSDWDVAIYPVEAHGFVQPTSWYDEYRRILELFEQHLQLK